MTAPQILLTEAEAAAALRLSARTLRKARAQGALHFVLIGRAVRYTMEDLESFVAALRKATAPCHTPAPAPRSVTRQPGAARSAQRGSSVILPFHLRGQAHDRL